MKSITAIFKNAVKAAELSLILAFSAPSAVANVSNSPDSIVCKVHAFVGSKRVHALTRFQSLDLCSSAAISNPGTEEPHTIVFRYVHGPYNDVSSLRVHALEPSPYNFCAIYGYSDRKKNYDKFEELISLFSARDLKECIATFLYIRKSNVWDPVRAIYRSPNLNFMFDLP
ncbi:MAG: hypothetical protein JNK24_02630 [Alphaproteobacteria bacterium]|nr:hypothetical protein [Alphaproteobacteria bacterium]